MLKKLRRAIKSAKSAKANAEWAAAVYADADSDAAWAATAAQDKARAADAKVHKILEKTLARYQ